MRDTGLLTTIGVVMALVSGCGDDDGGGGQSCEFVHACGGDVVGRWEVTGVCGEGVEVLGQEAGIWEPACRDAVRRVDLHMSGSYTFTADQVTTDLVSQIETELHFTYECLLAFRTMSSVDVPEVCDGIQQLYGIRGYESASCRVIGTACRCVVMSPAEHETATEPYTATNGVLTNGTEQISYCVQGDSLRFVDGEVNQFVRITARRTSR